MNALTAVKGHNLAPPTEQDLFASLDRLVGQAESRQLWASACRQAGIPAGVAMPADQLERALQQLKLAKGMASISANSILIRLKSHRTLSHLNQGGTP